MRRTGPTLPLAVVTALCATLLPALALTAASPASAAACPPSGGASIPPASATGDVVFRGGGWGHGLGMSQYGAQGAANLGCSAAEILGRYYAGTAVVSRPMPERVRLRMLDDGYRVDVRAVEGDLVWSLPGCVEGCPPVQPAGASWQLRLDDATGQYVLHDLGTTPRSVLWQGGSAATPLLLEQNGSVARLTTWRSSSIVLDRWLRWDRTRFSIDANRLDAVQEIGASAVGTAMDKYLWGIAEVPSSFPDEALKAQAIAARTYAAKRADRVLQPTPADQNYTGWKKETEGPGGVYGQRWRAAVDATSGQVIALADTGALIDAFYSSSMGGHTEDELYVWGVENTWLRAVDDSAWDLASSNPAEKRSWATPFSWGVLAAKLGYQHVSDISVPARGDADRVQGVRVTGIKGGRLVSELVEGWDVRQALGLLSPGFTVSFRTLGGKSAQPLSGDWDGDGDDEPGWFRKGRWALSMTTDGGAWTKRFRYGGSGDTAVVGDWDRDGDDDIGVFRDGTWLLRTSQSYGRPTQTVRFGKAGDVPVVGSWTGRNPGIGVVRGTTWKLRRSVSGGRPQLAFSYGEPGDVPVVGSWNGSRRDGIGVERDGTWLLRNRRSAGPAGIVVEFGRSKDRAVTGDWDGDGRSAPGVARTATFRLRAGLAADAAAARQGFRG